MVIYVGLEPKTIAKTLRANRLFYRKTMQSFTSTVFKLSSCNLIYLQDEQRDENLEEREREREKTVTYQKIF